MHVGIISESPQITVLGEDLAGKLSPYRYCPQWPHRLSSSEIGIPRGIRHGRSGRYGAHKIRGPACGMEGVAVMAVCAHCAAWVQG